MPDGEPAARFSVPVCPSVNNLFVDRKYGRGRARSPAYEAWANVAGWLVKFAKPSPVHGLVAVRIDAPVNRRRDLDNLAKPILDLLVAMNVIDDDNRVDELLIRRITGREDIEVSIWRM